MKFGRPCGLSPGNQRFRHGLGGHGIREVPRPHGGVVLGTIEELQLRNGAIAFSRDLVLAPRQRWFCGIADHA